MPLLANLSPLAAAPQLSDSRCPGSAMHTAQDLNPLIRFIRSAQSKTRLSTISDSKPIYLMISILIPFEEAVTIRYYLTIPSGGKLCGVVGQNGRQKKAGDKRGTESSKKKKHLASIDPKCLLLFGWGTRIRTLIGGVRVRCLAIRPSPKSCRLCGESIAVLALGVKKICLAWQQLSVDDHSGVTDHLMAVTGHIAGVGIANQLGVFCP
jgi:hypothetical protein